MDRKAFERLLRRYFHDARVGIAPSHSIYDRCGTCDGLTEAYLKAVEKQASASASAGDDRG